MDVPETINGDPGGTIVPSEQAAAAEELYRKYTCVFAPFGFTLPFSVAEYPVSSVAGSVAIVAVACVVKLKTSPKPIPAEF